MQTRLPFKDEPTKATDRRSIRLDTLGLPESIITKLVESGEQGMITIGDVQRLTEIGGQLTDVDGIGPESAAKIADAIAKWDEAHPADEPAEDWLSTSLSDVADIPSDALAAFTSANLTTVGDLVDWRSESETLTDIAGISEEMEEQIDAALDNACFDATTPVASDIGSE